MSDNGSVIGVIGVIAVVVAAVCFFVIVGVNSFHNRGGSGEDIASAVVDMLVNDQVVLACDQRDNGSFECYFERWR